VRDAIAGAAAVGLLLNLRVQEAHRMSCSWGPRLILGIVVVHAFIVTSVVAAAPTSSSSCVAGQTLPSNIHLFQLSDVTGEMLEHSSTFRQQCGTIVAAGRRVRISVRIDQMPVTGPRARAVVHRFAYGFLDVEITIAFGANYVELLAHELEHVREQLENLDLCGEEMKGRASRDASGVFETDRAAQAGRLVWSEVQASLRSQAATHAKTR
jgi:hypothetical protein